LVFWATGIKRRAAGVKDKNVNNCDACYSVREVFKEATAFTLLKVMENHHHHHHHHHYHYYYYYYY